MRTFEIIKSSFGPESMTNENEWNINTDIEFHEQAIIRLYDENLELKPNFTITLNYILLKRAM